MSGDPGIWTWLTACGTAEFPRPESTSPPARSRPYPRVIGVEMIDSIILTGALLLRPMPMQDQASVIRAANIVAARQAREVPAEWREFTLCISKRESGYGRHPDKSKAYKARNPKSSASGRYQFLDTSWRDGASWNVFKRLVSFGYDRATAKWVRQRLAETPISQWRPVYQDIAYAETLLSGEGQGWRHWHLAGSPCNRLVP